MCLMRSKNLDLQVGVRLDGIAARESKVLCTSEVLDDGGHSTGSELGSITHI